LALDFDGVVCDALAECAAVTWHASRGPLTAHVPPVNRAVAELPPEFLTTFASVRPHSRTLDDFMVANAVPGGRRVTRKTFEHYRDQIGPARLAAQAAVGEQLRAHWRTTEFAEWVALHTVYPGLAELLRGTDHQVAIVSAKDAESIWAILSHHALADHVQLVVGSCTDKRAVLTGLADQSGETVLFLDDNLANATAADALPGIVSRWATWGYHSPEDVITARGLALRAITLEQLEELWQEPVRSVRTP
jgi:phosphoglycolate phosphatase-like HAD superfamily hydrolase